ncbi:MAG: phage integrase N-terminal SAM-like domain-containing protein [Gemmatimonadaceae bacterium]|nr:phage integrase N-terminal SAM-like domain-containing protein [Gemmatimonadaceae bacterium]
MSHPPTLLSVLRDRALVKRYSPRAIAAYSRWVRAFIVHHRPRHPRSLGAEDVRAYLTHLARDRKVAASTQNQALAALQFLYRDVLELPLPSAHGIAAAKRPHRLPERAVAHGRAAALSAGARTAQLMAMLLYGAGLRVQECCELRLKDIDPARGEIRVRNGKGEVRPGPMLPRRSRRASRSRIAMVRRLVARRAADRWRLHRVLPGAYDHQSSRAMQGWRLVSGCVPSRSEYWHADSAQRRTHHVHAAVLGSAVRCRGW